MVLMCGENSLVFAPSRLAQKCDGNVCRRYIRHSFSLEPPDGAMSFQQIPKTQLVARAPLSSPLCKPVLTATIGQNETGKASGKLAVLCRSSL
jgi:hypothetical protein